MLGHYNDTFAIGQSVFMFVAKVYGSSTSSAFNITYLGVNKGYGDLVMTKSKCVSALIRYERPGFVVGSMLRTSLVSEPKLTVLLVGMNVLISSVPSLFSSNPFIRILNHLFISVFIYVYTNSLF
jgi:hypothetical protein